MGLHEWLGVVLFFALIAPTFVALTFGGIYQLIERKKTDGNGVKGSSA